MKVTMQVRRASVLASAIAALAACGDDAVDPRDHDAEAKPGMDAGAGERECERAAKADAEDDVFVDTETGRLHGTLKLPLGCEPYPLVVLYAGSGPTDRDGNNLAGGLHTDAYAQLADLLAEHGVASVRYDKRGVAASAGAIPKDIASFTFDDDVADAQLWAEQYEHDPRFSKLVLAGHSEGALWAVMIAQRVDADAVISLAGVGRSTGVVLREQLADQAEDVGLTPDELMQADEVIAQLEAGKRVEVETLHPLLAQLFAPGGQAYLSSWMQYDPVAEVKKLDVPILVAQGTTDFQVRVIDGELLAAASPNATHLEIEGMCHVLKEAKDDRAYQVMHVYDDPKLPLHPELASGLVRFLEGVSRN